MSRNRFRNDTDNGTMDKNIKTDTIFHISRKSRVS